LNRAYKYEEAITRLEYIIRQLEKGDLNLDEALSYFEEGINLIKVCSKMLDEAQGKIEILTKDLEGNATLKDYDGGLELIE